MKGLLHVKKAFWEKSLQKKQSTSVLYKMAWKKSGVPLKA
jgi:hypothetical protein